MMTRPALGLACLLVTSVAAAQPALAPASAPAAAALPAPGKGEGIVFTDRPGGEVEMSGESEAICKLKDGQRVKVKEVGSSGVGMGDSVDTIHACGKVGTIPSGNLLIGERLKSSPDGKLAIFHVVTSCGDGCHAVLWLLGPGGRRLQISDNTGFDLKTKWSATELRLRVLSAVDAGETVNESTEEWVISLKALDALKLAGGATAEEVKGKMTVKDDAGAVQKIGTHRWLK